MGGKVEVVSEKNKGTTFSVTFKVMYVIPEQYSSSENDHIDVLMLKNSSSLVRSSSSSKKLD